jgi:hypothetical protein
MENQLARQMVVREAVTPVTGGGEEGVRGVRKTEELIGEEVRAAYLIGGDESMMSVCGGPVHRVGKLSFQSALRFLGAVVSSGSRKRCACTILMALQRQGRGVVPCHRSSQCGGNGSSGRSSCFLSEGLNETRVCLRAGGGDIERRGRGSRPSGVRSGGGSTDVMHAWCVCGSRVSDMGKEKWCVGQPWGEWKMGPTRLSSCRFDLNQNFKLTRFDSIKRWSSRARKNPNKIWIHRKFKNNNFTYCNFSDSE